MLLLTNARSFLTTETRQKQLENGSWEEGAGLKRRGGGAWSHNTTGSKGDLGVHTRSANWDQSVPDSPPPNVTQVISAQVSEAPPPPHPSLLLSGVCDATVKRSRL